MSIVVRRPPLSTKPCPPEGRPVRHGLASQYLPTTSPRALMPPLSSERALPLGSANVVNSPFLLRNSSTPPPVGPKPPTICPRSLIFRAFVTLAPGASRVV